LFGKKKSLFFFKKKQYFICWEKIDGKILREGDTEGGRGEFSMSA